jgi:hypothetical protein
MSNLEENYFNGIAHGIKKQGVRKDILGGDSILWNFH